jgi:serine/threonine protein kinase
MVLDTSKAPMQTIGNYDLMEKIAEGGMGTVYKARQRSTGEVVAFKIIPAHLTSNPVLLKRFEQEFKAAKSLDHPNIIRALDYGVHEKLPYLVMEFIDGESLGQRLTRDGTIAEAEAIKIIAGAAQGLHRAHKQGMIHRDVKPDNIMVTRDGQVKLADLGLVKEVDADLNLTRTGRGLGTPHFMAPEQFRNAKNADVRCDIYSLAATLYMMVTGQLPFEACGPLDAWMKKINNELPQARSINPSLSERVNWAISRAMSADPTQRPGNCREFIEDLTGHSTRRITPAAGVTSQDFWYMVYKDEEGVLHTVKGTLPGIRRSLKEGLLGDASNIRASKTKQGPFELLRNHPEFRDMVVTAAPLKPVLKEKAAPSSAQPPTPPPTVPLGDPAPAKPAPARPPGGSPIKRLTDSKSPSDGATNAPLIDLLTNTNEPPPPEQASWLWVPWFLLAILVTAVVGFFVLPLLFPGR